MHFAEKIVSACDDVYLDQVLHYEDIESSVIVGIVEVTNLDKGDTSVCRWCELITKSENEIH